MTPTILKTNRAAIRLFAALRNAGFRAEDAIRIAKTAAEFQALEAGGLVRIYATMEEDSYFDVYGEPKGYTDSCGRRYTAEQERQRIINLIERGGCWCVFSQSWSGAGWEDVDCVGMIVGNPESHLDNPYLENLMRSAIDRIAENRQVSATVALDLAKLDS